MLNKIEVVDQINVIELGQIQIRVRTEVIEDGKIISKNYDRNVLNPGNDLLGQDDRVKVIAQAVWTQDVISAYQDYITSMLQDGISP